MFSVQAANCFHAGSYTFIRSLGSFRGTRMMAVSGPGRVASVRAERKTKNGAGSLPSRGSQTGRRRQASIKESCETMCDYGHISAIATGVEQGS